MSARTTGAAPSCAVLPIAERARAHARAILGQIVPSGTRQYDDVNFTRQTFENQLAHAIVFGYELGIAEAIEAVKTRLT